MNAIASGHEDYLRTLPQRPYCTNRLGGRLLIRDRRQAGGYAMIQHNSPLVWRWLVFDIDNAHAYTRAEERGCPPPTFIALNRANGHAHLAYRLESPVSAFSSSSRAAMKFFEDVERGMTNRLGADPAYPAFLSKNPLSSAWETDWQASSPYRLDTLNDYLDPSDKKRSLTREGSAIGRNVTVFDAVRALAYRQCLKFKSEGRPIGEFETMLRGAAAEVNASFLARLSLPEIKGIARSVAKWVWERFSEQGFSAIQRARASKRWHSAPTLTETKPWVALGVCRRTWERHRRQALPTCYYPDMALRHSATNLPPAP